MVQTALKGRAFPIFIGTSGPEPENNGISNYSPSGM
ncbi:TPA_asm: hypothetical protein HUJ06_000058 [Nelumbo nucifera]|uniref:Uncharacterized protein n=1 Tax=Nelumbo nucifera TaxID=4432 RepID=A0A822ZY86_NELNU|nr:TPA_asm: hypothetical protein HUJ06_000058 [Nelumbo nucifera]